GEVNIPGEQLRAAGRYTAILDDNVTTIEVLPAAAKRLSFLARPSRVPVAKPDVISGVAFVFDDFNDLVLEPTKVTFTLTMDGNHPVAKSDQAQQGAAWLRMPSSSKEGVAQFVASLEQGEPVRRVVRQVASDACNLRFHIQKTEKTIEAETEPI